MDSAMALKEQLVSFFQQSFFFLVDTVTWPIKKSFQILEGIAEFILVKARTTAQRFLFLWLIIVSVFTLSSIMYAVFIHVYMPQAEIARPVYFSSRICSSGHGLCSFPSANVTFWNNDGTIQEILGPGQFYNVFLELDMPDTPTNRDLGMFQVVIQMYDRNGMVSLESSRMLMYKYRCQFMRIIDLLVLSPFYFMGLLEEKQMVTVELLHYFSDDYYHPSIGAKIELQSHKIQFYKANLKFIAHFTGLKYMLYYWPAASAVFGILNNVAIISVFLICAMIKKARTLQIITQSLDFESLQSEFRRRQEQQTENVLETGSRQEREDVTRQDREEGGTTRNEEEEVQAVRAEGYPPPEPSETDEQESGDDSTHTKSVSGDDLDDYEIPLVQEPADFPVPDTEQDMDFLSELRHRRLN